MVKLVSKIQTELMVEIYSKGPDSAIGKVLLIAKTQNKTQEADEKWPLFVNKQLFWWSTLITLDNNNYALTHF